MWGEELEKPGEKKHAFTNEDSSPIKLNIISWKRTKDYQFKPTGNPLISLFHSIFQLQKQGSKMKELKLDPG